MSDLPSLSSRTDFTLISMVLALLKNTGQRFCTMFLSYISIKIKFKLCFCTNITEITMCSLHTPPGGYMTAMPRHKTVAFNPVSSGAACTMQHATHNQNRIQFAFL